MRYLVTAVILSAVPTLSWGQPVTGAPGPVFSVTISKQPLETFKAAFLTKLPGVALYRATTCNTDFSITGTVGGGFVLQASEAQAGIAVIDKTLVDATVQRARQKSKKYYASEIALWSSLLAMALVPGGGVATVAGTQIPWLAGVSLVSKKLSDNYNTSGVPVPQLTWLSADMTLTLSPRACGSALYLGSWSPKSPPSASATVTSVALTTPGALPTTPTPTRSVFTPLPVK